MNLKYTKSLFRYNRRSTRVVYVGNVPVGGNNPVVVQSMTDTDTRDVEATVNQCVRIAEAGAEIIRITTKGIEEAKLVTEIKSELGKRNINVPIIADVHFNPKVAEYAAGVAEKVRINPGNYADKKAGVKTTYSDIEYKTEINRIRTRIIPLIRICRKNKTALRIGTNHGSLSDRIMNRYGDTAEGMVESVLEFLRICVEEDFYEIIVSIKASNPVVMIHAYRLLVVKMAEENMDFPLHLGVTEAGDGIIGRIKSAVGIGTLLADGLGDTIRVSLTEAPENEIPVAKKLAKQFFNQPEIDFDINEENAKFLPEGFKYQRRKSFQVLNIGCDNVPVVIGKDGRENISLEYYFIDKKDELNSISEDKIYITESDTWKKFRNRYPNLFPIYNIKNYCSSSQFSHQINFLQIFLSDFGNNEENIRKNIELISSDPSLVIILKTNTRQSLGERRVFFMYLNKYNCKNPVILHMKYDLTDNETFIIKSATDSGTLFIDGMGDGLWLDNKSMDSDFTNSVSFDILQACRVRLTKPDYISCPGCGRTLFHLQETVAEIRKYTSHLKGLKIGIMGCIVNGPGEMADADYGYVGISPGKINLYKNQTIIKNNVPENQAVEELINLIKAEGDWTEPE